MKAYRIFVRDLVHSFGWRLAALVVLMALVGLSEGLSVALLLPLLSRIGLLQGSGSGIFSNYLEQILALANPHPSAALVLGVLVAVAALQAALFLAMNWWMANLVAGYLADWRRRLFDAFVAADWLYLAAHKSGDFTNAIVTETMRVSSAFIYALQLTAAVVVVVIYMLLALMISAQATLWVIAIALLLALAGSYLYRMSYGMGQMAGPLNAELQVLVGEYLSGVKLVKTSGSEARASTRVAEVVGRSERISVVSTFLPGALRGVFEFIAFCALVALLVFASGTSRVTPINLIVVLALFLRLLPRVSTVQTNLHALNVFVPAILDLERLLTTARAAAEPRLGLLGSSIEPDASGLQVEKLSVCFGARAILNDITFTLPVPGAIAVVGPSGSGKSTLLHALLGLVPAASGSMRIGTHLFGSTDIRSWRNAIGYVPQECVLFHASVRENLCFANPQASEAELVRAARLAHAHEFISDLPQSYDTVIGDQGVLLSGGQRQRLAIARALLRNPAVLLLDEPTSALDADSEREIITALQQLRTRIGILVVSHRPEMLRLADTVFALVDGRLVPSSCAQGSAAPVMAMPGQLSQIET